MRTNYYIQDGLIVKKSTNNDKDASGLFSLTKFFKKMLSRYHVAYNDDCCDTTADLTNLSVRFNQTTGHIQYYNPTNNTWTNATL